MKPHERDLYTALEAKETLRDELNRVKAIIADLQKRLNSGRDYLMGVNPEDMTVEETLEAFGWERNGLRG